MPGPTNGVSPSDADRRRARGAQVRRRIEAARRRLEGPRVKGAITRLKALDIANWTTVFGAELLWSVIPLLILLSSLANDRIDDDLSRHIGLDRQGAHIVRGLFRGSPSHDAVAITIGLLVSLAGSLSIARSLQEMYEQIFGQDHRGWRDISRHLAWVAVLLASLVAQAALVRSVHGAGLVVLVLVRFIAATLFFWFTAHFLLSGRVPWHRLIRTALVTAALWLALAGFSMLYFSSLLVSDSHEYGQIGVVFTFLAWFILVGAVLVLGAVGGSAWQSRAETRAHPSTPGAQYASGQEGSQSGSSHAPWAESTCGGIRAEAVPQRRARVELCSQPAREWRPVARSDRIPPTAIQANVRSSNVSSMAWRQSP